MKTKRIHYISGLIISSFVCIHLFNHVLSICGAEKHIETMSMLRLFYRNTITETILLLAVFVQIVSGFRLFKNRRKNAVTLFDNLQIWTGLYLALFLSIHVSVVLGGRLLLNLDTNFYFGVAGLNTFPFNLFFIPYYALAILSFFGHIAAIHYKKMRHTLLSLSPKNQSVTILLFGIILTVAIFYGLTNRFRGVIIPNDYNVLIGK